MQLINSIYIFGSEKYRILKFLPYYVIWISIDNKNAFPELITSHEFKKNLDNNEFILVEDPYEYINLLNPDENSIQFKKRNTNFAIIQDLINEDQILINPKIRVARIKEIHRQKNISTNTIFRLLRRYWQRGQTLNALIPDYDNSGARGTKRTISDKKIGRPRVYGIDGGKNVTKQVELYFKQIIEEFLLPIHKIPINEAHHRFKKLFSDSFPYVQQIDIPTYNQFYYFYNKNYRNQENGSNILANQKTLKDHKPLTSTATKQVNGPGSRYEIDSTIADIYLVSARDQSIIGRPTVYIVIDVFSRLITGLYIGMENSSFNTAIQALSVAIQDKVEFCETYGLSIQSEDWPAYGLPGAILADRGELIGYQIELLEKNFSVRIENAPPYRSDAKGIVERAFGTIQSRFKNYNNIGVVSGFREKKKGGHDYRLDACLTLEEFRKIILASVLFHNNHHVLTKYDRSADMPVSLPSIPIKLWKWGLQHRTGMLRQVDSQSLYVGLLPRTKASLSDQGIKVKGLLYECVQMHQKGWFIRNTTKSRPKTIMIGFDPYSVNTIYVFFDENKLEYWEAQLSDFSRQYRNLNWWETGLIQKAIKTVEKQHIQLKSSALNELHEFTDNIVKTAKSRQAQAGVHDLSKAQRTRDIRQNKIEAVQQERAEYIQNRPVNPLKTVHDQDTLQPNQQPSSSNNLDLNRQPDLMRQLFEEEDEE
ncbi:MAG: DDE-type integrase/transposase/recombinase [Acinetobacter sp.]|uniref:Mu transposase C-terminal domain-containing protein n=1 Tax=Acinetobacter sp. TaxID=472 RepID=UPI00257EA8DA|nr:Mu transposase C-terminal domain-containing protein [Acinetobacter sp.]MBR5556196.1 DDE-type integrase/transposase/recombinase [Acinetobacter sp.]